MQTKTALIFAVQPQFPDIFGNGKHPVPLAAHFIFILWFLGNLGSVNLWGRGGVVVSVLDFRSEGPTVWAYLARVRLTYLHLTRNNSTIFELLAALKSRNNLGWPSSQFLLQQTEKIQTIWFRNNLVWPSSQFLFQQTEKIQTIWVAIIVSYWGISLPKP